MTSELENPIIAVVIPCYKVEQHLASVLTTIPDIVNHIIVVDDSCPDGSGDIANDLKQYDDRIHIIRHECNQGVGGATITGYAYALELECDITVKLDGDGQMDPDEIPRLIAPLISGKADYAKGNRFQDFGALGQMPTIRLFGNSSLSFFVKAASGYWRIMDPTNGYTAIRKGVLEKLDLSRISKDYFFESDMLIKLNIAGAIVSDVSIPAKYGQEISSLQIGKALRGFPVKLFLGLVTRIFIQYFLYDFNMGSVYILFGLPLFLFGVIFGAIEWVDSIVTGMAKPAGTIILSALPIILGFQMLLQAIQIDIDRTTSRRRP